MCIGATCVVPRGSLPRAQSEFAGIGESLSARRRLDAEIISRQSIPIGPVLRIRAHWLEITGQLRNGERH